ncbi:MAG: phage head closure protein [Rhizomicrobium sp.]
MIGDLNQRADLLQKVQTADAGGGSCDSWQRFATVWVKLAVQSSEQNSVGDGLQARVRYRLTLRRRSDVAAGQRVALATRLFDILAVGDAGPSAETSELLCEVLP